MLVEALGRWKLGENSAAWLEVKSSAALEDLMEPTSSLLGQISTSALGNFAYDLVKWAGGSGSTPIDAAIAQTVQAFPQFEGLETTFRQWLRSPEVTGSLNQYVRGVKGLDEIRLDVPADALVESTQFFVANGSDAVAREIVSKLRKPPFLRTRMELK